MKLVYFAWVRERVGIAEEEISLPPGVTTVKALLDWLTTRGEAYAEAFRCAEAIRVAIDREHVEHDALLPSDGEIALFPPMTGG